MPKQKETVGTGDTAKQSRLEREALLQRIQDKTESDYVMNGMTQPESPEEEPEEEEE